METAEKGTSMCRPAFFQQARDRTGSAWLRRMSYHDVKRTNRGCKTLFYLSTSTHAFITPKRNTEPSRKRLA